MSRPIARPVGPTRFAERSTSMPPPDPRSRTRSPSRRSATAVGLPQPSDARTAASGSSARSRAEYSSAPIVFGIVGAATARIRLGRRSRVPDADLVVDRFRRHRRSPQQLAGARWRARLTRSRRVGWQQDRWHAAARARRSRARSWSRSRWRSATRSGGTITSGSPRPFAARVMILILDDIDICQYSAAK